MEALTRIHARLTVFSFTQFLQMVLEHFPYVIDFQTVFISYKMPKYRNKLNEMHGTSSYLCFKCLKKCNYVFNSLLTLTSVQKL